MDKRLCQNCGELVFDDMVFVKGIGWICLDCSIEVDQGVRTEQLEVQAARG